MGQLVEGTPLSWHESQKYITQVKRHGIQQFINTWNRNVGKKCDALLWGDELEFLVVSFNEELEKVTVSLRQKEILGKINQSAKTEIFLASDSDVFEKLSHDPRPFPSFHPEYGRYMIEATPGVPFVSTLTDLAKVEWDMRLRRSIIEQYLRPNESLLSLAVFPLLGRGKFCIPYNKKAGDISRSSYLPDDIINEHIRFPTLTKNIRERRGCKVVINIPVFKDKHTPDPFIDPELSIPHLIGESLDLAQDQLSAKEGHIYMDAMGFGMGCCCLQVTFQSSDVEEARNLYDQLTPITPLMLALTAASPIFKGYLADQDCRWNVISSSVDDRTAEEKKRISKSRYDSVSCYLSNNSRFKNSYNDESIEIDRPSYEKLRKNGIDELMAKHIAHLFIRDPLVVFKESLDVDDLKSTNLFESINTSNWQSMRFKPPPIDTNIGWRVEFRTMEIQATDFENTAFCIFLVLLTRTMISFNLNFYIPISLVDENMRRAHLRDSCLNTKFWFRKDIFPEDCLANGQTNVTQDRQPNSQFIELTCDELINGTDEPKIFPGLAPLIINFLNRVGTDFFTLRSLKKYIDHVCSIAKGTTPTMASRLRTFVQSHRDYKFDSQVSERIAYDLLRRLKRDTEEGISIAML